MSTLNEFLEELNSESIVTRKMLMLIPEDQKDYKPHVKSMSMSNLAQHIAELPGWATMAFNTEELDFAKEAYTPKVWNDNQELLDLFNQSLSGAQETLKGAKEEDLGLAWLLKNGDQILVKTTKGGLVRLALSQIIHHRAQLGVYLRLLDIPIPGTYGPSADDQNF